MTSPENDAPDLAEGTDIEVDADDLGDDTPTPATSDPEQMTEDEQLGGVGGGSPGGAG